MNATDDRILDWDLDTASWGDRIIRCGYSAKHTRMDERCASGIREYETTCFAVISGWHSVRELAAAVAEHISREHPGIAAATSG